MPADVKSLQALPKAHLHLHLEGSMRPATLAELAQDQGVEVPAGSGYGSFAEFAGRYTAACQVITGPDELRRLVREVVQDAAADGAIWLEPHFYPVNHRARFGTDAEAVGTVLAEGRRAAAELGIGFGLIVAANRTAEPAQAEALAHVAAASAADGVVGFGLMNNEDGFPPEPFAKAFAIARAAGLMGVPHAGELAGPASVRGALDSLHAQRIAHGVRSVEDPRLLERLAADQICLDVCPTSNVMLSVVPDIAAHPLAQLLQAGVQCSINADDSLLFGPGLLAEYELCRTELALSDEQLAFAARCSIVSSGAPAAVQARGRTAIDDWLSGPGRVSS